MAWSAIYRKSLGFFNKYKGLSRDFKKSTVTRVVKQMKYLKQRKDVSGNSECNPEQRLTFQGNPTPQFCIACQSNKIK